MKKQLIISFVLGAITIAFCYHAYVVYQLKAQVDSQGVALTQVIQFLNQASAKK